MALLAFAALLPLFTFAASTFANGAIAAHSRTGSLSPYLRPASGAEVTRCEDAARSVDLDVLCPLVLPKGQYAYLWCENGKSNPCGYPCVFGACFLAQVVFTAPHT